MSFVNAFKFSMDCPHEFESKLSNLYLKGNLLVFKDRDFPERVRGVVALFNNHAIESTEQTHQFNVPVSHFFKAVDMIEVDLVINLFLLNNPVFDVTPRIEIAGLVVEVQALADEVVDATELTVLEGNFMLLGLVSPQYGLGVFVFVLLAERTHLVDEIVQYYSHRPNVVLWLIAIK